MLTSKQEVEKLFSIKESRLLVLYELIRGHTKKSQGLNRIIQYVREAEAFMATDCERESRIKRLEDERKRLSDNNA